MQCEAAGADNAVDPFLTVFFPVIQVFHRVGVEKYGNCLPERDPLVSPILLGLGVVPLEIFILHNYGIPVPMLTVGVSSGQARWTFWGRLP